MEILKYPFNTNPDNYALAIEKFGRFKKDKLEYMDTMGNGLFHKFNDDPGIIGKALNKQQSTIKCIEENDKHEVVQISAKQTWRMAVGLGNASVYNNGFQFHPVYGIPYLCGSQVKGIVRSFIIDQLFSISASDEPDIKLRGIMMEEKAFQDPVFCYLFGCTEKSYDGQAKMGNIHFLDAFPDNDLTIEPDIMNPHYGDYYGDDRNVTPPADYLSPVPIFFLSLKNATFNFCFWIQKEKNVNTDVLTFRKKDKENTSFVEKKYEEFDNTKDGFVNKLPSEIISKWLDDALEIKGIGGKTAVGYGRCISEGKENAQIKEQKKLEQDKLEQDKLEQEKRDQEKRIQEELICEKQEQEKSDIINKGIAAFLAPVNDYTSLLSKMKEWLILNNIRLVTENSDINTVLQKLDAIYGSLKGGKKKKQFNDNPSKLKTVTTWIGEEIATDWFNSKKQNT